MMAKKCSEQTVTITKAHAYSLRCLVNWFKKMSEDRCLPDALGRSDELTAAYCDELLKDLKE